MNDFGAVRLQGFDNLLALQQGMRLLANLLDLADLDIELGYLLFEVSIARFLR